MNMSVFEFVFISSDDLHITSWSRDDMARYIFKHVIIYCLHHLIRAKGPQYQLVWLLFFSFSFQHSNEFWICSCKQCTYILRNFPSKNKWQRFTACYKFHFTSIFSYKHFIREVTIWIWKFSSFIQKNLLKPYILIWKIKIYVKVLNNFEVMLPLKV